MFLLINYLHWERETCDGFLLEASLNVVVLMILRWKAPLTVNPVLKSSHCAKCNVHKQCIVYATRNCTLNSKSLQERHTQFKQKWVCLEQLPQNWQLCKEERKTTIDLIHNDQLGMCACVCTYACITRSSSPDPLIYVAFLLTIFYSYH